MLWKIKENWKFLLEECHIKWRKGPSSYFSERKESICFLSVF